MDSTLIQLKIEGSTGNSYTVSFSRDGNTVKTSCTCAAGEMKTHCKHRLAIFSGDLTMVQGVVQEDLMSRIAAMIKATELEEALNAFKEADIELSQAKKKLQLVKKKLDRIMHP